MSLHPGTANYNPAGNSDFTRKAEALALGITNWSTPKATDGAKGGPGQTYGSGGTPPLPVQAAQWQTPVADDQVDRVLGKINSRGEPKLSTQAIQWPTPAAQNWKGSSPASVTRADGKSRMDILHYRAEQGFTHPEPAITRHGLQAYGFGMEYVLIQRARLGCKVDGGGHKSQSYTHEDAEIVAGTLAGMPDSFGGKRMAIYVAELARAGMTPDWMPGVVPRCVPVETKSNQHGERSTTVVIGVERVP
jgi:hypothetical protein